MTWQLKTILLSFILLTDLVYSQTDSIMANDPEDLLPAVTSESISYDFLEENLTDYSIQLRSRYLSNPDLSPKIYNRLKSYYGNYSAGIITEKDAGERNYTDFYSFYFSFKGTDILKEVIAGNYTLSFGSGLVATNAYRSAKTSDVFFPINKNRTYIKPYLSTDENKFFRGIAVSFSSDALTVTPFVSYNRFDTGIDSNGVINSIPLSGSHITAGELFRKDAGKIAAQGIITEYYSNLFNTSIFYMHSSFGNEINSTLPFKKINNYLSVFYEVPVSKNLNISGESASDMTYNNHIITANILLSKEVAAITSYRNYQGGFSSYYGNAFSEEYNSKCNESGFYSGVRLNLSPLMLDIYFDQYKISALSKSFSGEELLFNGKYRFDKYSLIKIKFRSRIKESPLEILTAKKNFSLEYAMFIDQSISENIKLEYLKNNAANQGDGFMFYNEIGVRLDEQIEFNFRVTLFKTNSFESSLYEYEKDLPGMFSSKILSGEGMRYYMLVKYDPFDFLKLSLKYSYIYKRESTLSFLNLQTDITL